jgi:hypothetical protein
MGGDVSPLMPLRSRSFSSLENYNRHWKAKSLHELLQESGGETAQKS